MTAKRFFHALAASLLLGLSACELADLSSGLLGPAANETAAAENAAAATVLSVRGGVAADEPRAALIARDVLREGGNAADAATALYFGLAVTYPSRASLGGGGACLVFDPKENEVRAIDFVPREGALPANVDGMAALHARYGRLRWQRLVAPAESLARFGFPVSRALAADLDAAATLLLTNPESVAAFGSPQGGPLREGERLAQPELADTLVGIRLKGAAAFHSAGGAVWLAAAAVRSGVDLKPEALLRFEPRWEKTVRLDYRDAVLHTLPPPAESGIVALNLWQLLAVHDRYVQTPVPERPHLVAEASQRAFADRAAGLPGAGGTVFTDRLERAMASYRTDAHEPAPASPARPEGEAAETTDLGQTSFVVIDEEGMAVTCGFVMNGLFGAGRIAASTGIVLAAPAAGRGDGPALLMMVARARPDLVFAAAASGGASAPGALVSVALGAIVEGESLKQAMARVRLKVSGASDLVLLEPGFPPEVMDGLKRKGHAVETDGLLGRVNASFCRQGARSVPASCTFESDIRGFGAALDG